MDKKTKNRLKNIAADILVSPLTAIAASKEMVKKFNESENGQKTIRTLKEKGREVSEAVQSASEKKKSDKAKESVKEVAGKIGGVFFTGGLSKVNEFLHDGDNEEVSERNAENSENNDKNSEDFVPKSNKDGKNSNCGE